MCLAITAAFGGTFAAWRMTLGPANLAEVRERVTPRLKADLAAAGFELGQSIFLRIFKEPGELEVWLMAGDRFRHFRTYPICNYSGDLGPKLEEGDRQSPEGFYSVGPEQLNPNSQYHLSFNLGFPNAFDRSQGRTGSYLMIHGDCLSVGCYAMTDAGIEEIYLLAEAALTGGQQSFWVHAFPFRMTEANMAARAQSPWVKFWRNMQEGYVLFEATGLPPEVRVADGAYVFAPVPQG